MRCISGSALVVAVIALGVLPVAAQTPARDSAVLRTSSASIQGRVVEAGSDIGIVRALVTITGATLGRQGRSVLTDEQGRYAFTGLSAGSYTLQAGKLGYVTLGPGQRRMRQPPRTLELADDQILPETNIALPRAGVIVVRVTNAFGEPLALHSISVQEYRIVNGQRTLSPARRARDASMSIPRTPFTNDLGQVRVYGLAPGEYYLSVLSGSMSALARSGDDSVTSEMYFPGTPVASEARPVVVIGGQETEVGFQLAPGAGPARRVAVSGFVRNSTGSAATSATLSSSATRSYVPILPDGSFEMTNVGPGEHKISVRAGQGPGEIEEWGRVTVKVQDEDVTGVTVYTTRTGILRGRFIFDTGAPPSDLQPGALKLAVLETLETFGPLPAESKWNDDWSFEIGGLAGPYILRLREPANGWHLKTIVRDGKETTDAMVDVNGAVDGSELRVVVTRGTTLTGAVVDGRNLTVTEYVAVVFPEDSNRWRDPHSRFIATSRSNQQGQFRITGLPPGRYLAAAVEYLETGEERDPDVLRQISQEATPLTLEEGESKAVMLRLSTY